MPFIDLEKIEAIAEPVVNSIHCELVACEWLFEGGRRILRVFIDKPEGVNISDCEHLSRLLEPVLDVEEVIEGPYSLEISSPGLDRPLKKISDFDRFASQVIRLKTKIPVENRSHFKGILKGRDEEIILLEVDRHLYRIPYKEIYRANLEVDWPNLLKKKKK